MKTIRVNLDEANVIWFCIGTRKGCEDENSRSVCDKCLTGAALTMQEITDKIEKMPEVPSSEKIKYT